VAAEPRFSLNELSPAHLELAAALRDTWLPAGVATGPGDRAEAVAGAAEAYRSAGLAPPGLPSAIWSGSR
jgi:hypothetical protein